MYMGSGYEHAEFMIPEFRTQGLGFGAGILGLG